MTGKARGKEEEEVFIFLLINLRVFFAFPVMLFMWGVQFKSLLIVTPRYLAALVTLSSLLCS